MNSTNDRENDVSLIAVFRELFTKLPFILIIAFVVAAITFCVNYFLLTPMYVSETKIYVLARNDSQSDSVTTGELQAGELLTRDYEDIIKSRQVLEQVIQDLDLKTEKGSPVTYENMLSMITVQTTTGKRTLVIRVQHPDPALARDIADSVRNVSAEQIQDIMDTRTVKTVDTANLPTAPNSPHVVSNTVKAGLAGFLAGCVLFFILILMNDTIRDEEDVERYLKISALGAIPKFDDDDSSRRTRTRPRDLPEKTVGIRIPEEDYRIEEAFRALRTNLQFCGVDKKVIAITSCVPNEGKSSIALRLAIALAGIGKETFFVDADMRKSVLLDSITTYGKGLYGLSEFLSGQMGLDDVAMKTDVDKLYLITSGFFPPNPTELLSGPNFKNMIDALRSHFDYVIIDCPPLGNVIDSAVIARECDGTILVVDSGNISYHFAQEVLKQLERSNCPVLGAVVNKLDTPYHVGKYGKYYTHYYGKYGRYFKKYGKQYGPNGPSGNQGGSKKKSKTAFGSSRKPIKIEES